MAMRLEEGRVNILCFSILFMILGNIIVFSVTYHIPTQDSLVNKDDITIIPALHYKMDNMTIEGEMITYNGV